MIVAVGVDIVEVERIRKAMRDARFAQRILTLKEQDNGSTASYVAGRWAVKEAIAKAVGTHLTWQEVEVLNDPKGRPKATLQQGLEGYRLHVSISHEKGHAVGLAILEAVTEA